jgi:hypothetical protein
MRIVLPLITFFFCVTHAWAVEPAGDEGAAKKWYQTISHDDEEAIFAAIWDKGEMHVFKERVSLWRFMRGEELYDDLYPLQILCNYAEISRLEPMYLGPIGVMAAISPLVDKFRIVDMLAAADRPLMDPSLIQMVEDSFGSMTGISVQLPESPALVENVELLAGLPWLSNVTILMKDPLHPDERLADALRKLRVVGYVYLCDLDGNCPEVEALLQEIKRQDVDAP